MTGCLWSLPIYMKSRRNASQYVDNLEINWHRKQRHQKTTQEISNNDENSMRSPQSHAKCKAKLNSGGYSQETLSWKLPIGDTRGVASIYSREPMRAAQIRESFFPGGIIFLYSL